MVIDPPTDIMAFVGGYYAHRFSGFTLKLVFGALLVLAGWLMLRPVHPSESQTSGGFGHWHRSFGGREYCVNILLTVPLTAGVGFVAGMVGISGGSFKVPLMVLACGVPTRIAIGTSSAMVAVTAAMGFLGHTAGGDFDPRWITPLAVLAVGGGLLGGRWSLKADPRTLKRLFAWTTLAAAMFMAVNAFFSV